MEPYTKQSAFDKAAVHLLKKREKSVLDGAMPSCAYRGRDGLRCAIGVLLPDVMYDITDETLSASTIMEQNSEFADLFPFNNASIFLDNLQEVHDHYDVIEWRKELIKLAQENGLSTAAIDNL